MHDMQKELSTDELMGRFLNQLKDEDQLTEKQKRIMEAAVKLFSEKGFHAASTSEIAKEAGVAEGTIFRHFKTKKDILISLVAPIMLRFASPLLLKDVRKLMGSDLPLDDLLKQLYQNRLQIIEKNWSQIRLIIQEMQFHEELRGAVVENLFGVGRKLAEAFVSSKIQSGEIRNFPPLTVTRALVSMMVGYVFFKFVIFPDEGMNLDDEQEIEIMVDIILNGIRNKE
ncbi:TetR/AcrR family transcriptional regulator [Ammoniphilus resinae]|uniref:AcrR family transcriptional regulator n=1 Tax=Ammoniphilus resinae TaxID=861532 RepID=A0ABS4GMH5_9BACL|nr:TetR/AcrR family transcriptional regulator [Ammoniphilus resinae]MBP1931441.1 AcrR family transcriptional regulator [Ammoniphilus resinae]